MFKKKSLKFYVLFTYLSATTFAIFKITKQTYGVNDDVIIQNWLSGFYTGTPELMIRGSATPRISFGFIVSNLYELIPSVNWFSIILLGVTLLSWFLLGLLAFRSNNFLAITVYFVISFVHLLWFIPSPTYTAAAVILSFSSLIFLSKQISEGRVNFSFLPITFAYVFSFFIRPESFLLGSAVTVPFILFAVIKNQQVIRQNLKLILSSLLIVVSAIGIDVTFEKIYYSNNTNWTEYREWEQARYKIQANAPEKAVLENPAKYGWTKAEAEIFKNYNSIDPNYFTVDKLNKLIFDSQSETKIDFKFLQKAHQQIFDSDINWEWKRLVQLISLVFLLFFFLSFPRPSNFFLLSVSSFFIIYLIMLYIAGFLRQPERVQVSVIFISILVSWTSFIFTLESKPKNEMKHFAIIGWLVFILVAFSATYQASYLKTKSGVGPNLFWQNQNAYLMKYPNDSIFVGNASQFRNNWISPYKVEYFPIESRLLSFGWHNFSPHWIKRSEELGLDSNNLFNEIIDDPRVYWVSDSQSMEYIVSYMNEQGYKFDGPDVAGEMEYAGNEYFVWKFNPSE